MEKQIRLSFLSVLGFMLGAFANFSAVYLYLFIYIFSPTEDLTTILIIRVITFGIGVLVSWQIGLKILKVMGMFTKKEKLLTQIFWMGEIAALMYYGFLMVEQIYK